MRLLRSGQRQPFLAHACCRLAERPIAFQVRPAQIIENQQALQRLTQDTRVHLFGAPLPRAANICACGAQLGQGGLSFGAFEPLFALVQKRRVVSGVARLRGPLPIRPGAQFIGGVLAHHGVQVIVAIRQVAHERFIDEADQGRQVRQESKPGLGIEAAGKNGQLGQGHLLGRRQKAPGVLEHGAQAAMTRWGIRPGGRQKVAGADELAGNFSAGQRGDLRGGQLQPQRHPL